MAIRKDEAHPFWAPAHNREERWQEAEAARAADRERRAFERQCVALARRRGLTGDQARNFLLRQRASWKRHQQERQEREVLMSRSVVWCCDRWHPIQQIPLRVVCCGKVYLGTTGTVYA